ncbi:MAG: RNA polymerase sigma factor RpoH [Pseudomonadales bacterium]|nr:RNA polymerase sigma factor RpoH [Pseudomonadales bacterium]MDG1444050.1 RNA polymerase sigma factor RpoH [Pseudomonadales bacterium]
MTAIALRHPLPALSTSSLQSYLDSLQQIPILSREEEQDLFKDFHETNDLDAARTLVLSHLRYVAYIARSYTGYGLPLEDLIQQGNVGLMKSVKRFDASRNVRLVTFAVHWIKSEIHEYILKNWKIVKIATTKAQRKLFFNLRKAKSRLGWFNSDEVELVANDLNVKPSEVLEMESRLGNFDESFDAPADEDDFIVGPSNYLSLGEQEDPAWVASSDEVTSLKAEGLAVALAALDERSRDIVEKRWLMDEKMGLKELSQQYGVSMERIRQIEKKAFEQMQGHLVL